jgi:hypothetical protein
MMPIRRNRIVFLVAEKRGVGPTFLASRAASAVVFFDRSILSAAQR